MSDKKEDFQMKLDMENMELKAKLEREKMLKQAELDMKAMELSTSKENSDMNSNENKTE